MIRPIHEDKLFLMSRTSFINQPDGSVKCDIRIEQCAMLHDNYK